MEPKNTYFDKKMTKKKVTYAMTNKGKFAIKSAPAVVAMAFPPLKPAKIGKQWPTTAISPK